MLLPESMWSIHSLLQPGSSDKVSPRLTGRCQLAQTAFIIVYTATLDGDKRVVVKVRGLQWGQMTFSIVYTATLDGDKMVVVKVGELQ